MPATPQRITFIKQAFRTEKVENSTNKTLFGNIARKTDEPIPTFFNSMLDVAATLNARASLLTPLRRRFAANVQGAEIAQALDYGSSTPTAKVVSEEHGADMPTATVGFVIDLDKDTSILNQWG